jgi:IS30 family transposase
VLLGQGLSPEQIAGRLRYEGLGETVSYEWIYQFIARDRHNGGELHKCLRRRGKRYRKRRDTTGRCGAIKDRVPISERPEAVEARHRLGDWEGDTVHDGRGNLVTVVDRKSGFLRVALVAQRTASNVARAIKRLLREDPCETLTLDNGSEFAEHRDISQRLQMPVYFAEPYASWQRGANENANGLLRQYLPKGCDMLAISTRKLNAIVQKINLRPRKRLGWKCPAEVFYGTSVALVS